MKGTEEQVAYFLDAAGRAMAEARSFPLMRDFYEGKAAAYHTAAWLLAGQPANWMPLSEWTAARQAGRAA